MISQKVTQDVFCEIRCLTEQSTPLPVLELQKKWFRKSDRRYLVEALQNFIVYNREMLDFLGITPIIIGQNKNVSLSFRTSQYVGAVPLRAPDTGKQIGDFSVIPRYISGEDRFGAYIQILNRLEHRIEPQFIDSIPLVSGRNFRPPLYFEAILYLKELSKFVKRSWHKFKSVEEIQTHPTNRINWERYVEHEYDPKRRLEFPSQYNILSGSHVEYQNLKYVYELALNEIHSPETPTRIKTDASTIISFLDKKLHELQAVKTQEMQQRLSDPPAVKSIKESANQILRKELHQGKAWRVDFSEVFERFVQYIFKEVSKEIGGELFENIKFRAEGGYFPVWELRYLEPDAILRKDDLFFFIDAKYKAHLLSRKNNSETLKEEYRRDLHQILAYSSFDIAENKHVFLVYPSISPYHKAMVFINPLGRNKTELSLLGVPLNVSYIFGVKQLIHAAIASRMK